ncbi:AtpZ/AtpI family protein [Euryhalocaulis caribicus]|uniref:AtpZ/AtpI family protein n=1 Tax=Euryhalocaulis caribicus TaxID=1161401 RepID=UPI0003A868E8|nr:AtpZ/AtpI family protein [Euryhalocaulis caribicus]
MSDPNKPKRDASISELDEFEQRLQARRATHQAQNAKREPSEAERGGLAAGLRYGGEFAAGVLIGAGLGFLVDLATGAPPWGLFIGAMLGFAAGVRNVVRAAQDLNAKGSPPDGA